jgi:hypothetical protein
MMHKVVLSECLGQHVGGLVRCTNRVDLDELIADLLTKVMVAHINMLGARAEFWKSGKFEGSRIIFEYLTINIRFGADDRDVVFFHFLDEFHDRDDIAKRHRHSNILSFSG